MNETTRLYRSKDGSKIDYTFRFKKQKNGKWRAYITKQPSYKTRSTDLHPTHRLRDDDGHLYVCWTKPFESLEDAMAVSAIWADATQKYIKDGTRF